MMETILRTRADWVELVLRYWRAARPHLTTRRGRWAMDVHTAHHSKAGAEMEGFSRQLWAIVPLIAGGSEFPDTELLLEGIAAGVDPEHASFWGYFGDYEQRMVECAVIGAALRMCPEVFWKGLSDRSRSQLADYLMQINRFAPCDNNWLFFRVLVNCGLRHVGIPIPEDVQSQTLERLESFLCHDCWYTDGPDSRIDYYNPTGFHFYGLLYGQWEAASDAQRAARLRQRAHDFAPGFLRWFDRHGAAIPYGRSLTYRFAQGAFWSALATEPAPPLSYGQLKGLIARHMRWWQSRPIHHVDGTLARGYGYPQEAMTEHYNAIGSPAWGFKIFWMLSLPEQHAFWQAAEEPLLESSDSAVQIAPQMVFSRDPGAHHAVAGSATPAGAPAPWVRHYEEKYAKLAYSSQLAFAVPLGRAHWDGHLPDSCLLVRFVGGRWQTRQQGIDFASGEDWVRSRWELDDGQFIETTLTLRDGVQTRRHVFQLNRELEAIEGAFAVPQEAFGQVCIHGQTEDHGSHLALRGGEWISSICIVEGDGELQPVSLPPGSHLLFPAAQVPVRTGRVLHGSTVWVTRVNACFHASETQHLQQSES